MVSFSRDAYIVNPKRAALPVQRGHQLPTPVVFDAIEKAHGLIDQIVGFDIDLFPLLGMRNLSAFIGELFAASLIKACDGQFVKNPHQDGYPDLLLMDDEGCKQWELLKDRRREKAPFSPFPTGGIEVKATCGSVPTPQVLARRGFQKPDIGEQRVALLTGYDWKAHHRDTNNLMAIFWDFIDGAPRIVAVFYSVDLTLADWGGIIQPKEGGGRTTSVSIMTRAGVRKMFDNWVLMLNDDRYRKFFERRNGAMLLDG